MFPKLTLDLLRSYRDAALDNAGHLCAEASLFLEHGHAARAYFLAVASVEEVGKALFCFDAENRNLSDPAVPAKLKAITEDHSQKITYALGSWAMDSSDQRAALQVAVELMIAMKRGREPSMYSDLRSDPDRAQSPQEVVRMKAAADCVRLSKDCLLHARQKIEIEQPRLISYAEEKTFAMKTKRFREILRAEDFWWYYLSRAESGSSDGAQAVIEYDENYFRPGRSFRTIPNF